MGAAGVAAAQALFYYTVVLSMCRVVGAFD
jgi:hypothetical protein